MNHRIEFTDDQIYNAVRIIFEDNKVKKVTFTNNVRNLTYNVFIFTFGEKEYHYTVYSEREFNTFINCVKERAKNEPYKIDIYKM